MKYSSIPLAVKVVVGIVCLVGIGTASYFITDAVAMSKYQPKSYIVKKAKGSTFTDITDDVKNYKCKYVYFNKHQLKEDKAIKDADAKGLESSKPIETKIVYDNLCTLRTFPKEPNIKVHSFKSIKEQTNFKTITPSTASQDDFILTIDSRITRKIGFKWVSPNIFIVPLEEGLEAKDGDASANTNSQTGESQAIAKTEVASSKRMQVVVYYEIEDYIAAGNTKYVLLKYKGRAENKKATLPAGKCSLFHKDLTGFDCKIKPVKTVASDFTDAVFANTAETSFEKVAENSYFFANLGTHKRVEDFNKYYKFYFGGSDHSNNLITFEIVNFIAGDVNTAYYLKEPITT